MGRPRDRAASSSALVPTSRPMPYFGSVFHDVLDDLFSLVDLHGKDGLIGALVGELVDSAEECSCDLIDPILQHLRKAQENGKLQVFGFLDLLDEVHNVHMVGLGLIRNNYNIAFIIY